MKPTTLSQVNCQTQAILALLDGIKQCFSQGQKGINLFLQGRTGTGKSTIARCLALDFGGCDDAGMSTIYQTGAKIITIDELREWKDRLRYYGFYGRQVLIIDEAQHLSNDQQTALLTLLERNEREGNTIIILTAMFADEEITGARAGTWKPLKDRCIVPPLGDIDDPAFQAEIIEHAGKIIESLGLALDPATVCKEAGYSLRAIYARVRLESHLAGVTIDDTIFLGNDQEIAERLQATLEATSKPRTVDTLSPASLPSKPLKSARKQQYSKNLGDNGVTLLDMTAQILAETGRPMFPLEIARRFEANYPEMVFVSKNPRCSINANVSKDITINGTGSRFVKIDRRIDLKR